MDVKQPVNYLDMVKKGVSGYLDNTCPRLRWDANSVQNTLRQPKISDSVRTLLNEERLDNIQACIASVIDEKVPGDIFEAGCWKGGSAILAKACLHAFANQDALQRQLWCADKFEDMRGYYSTPLILLGQPFLKLFARTARLWPYSIKNALMNILNKGFPKDNYDKSTIDLYFNHFATISWLASIRHKHFLMLRGLDDVKEAFARYGLLDDDINFLPGWFEDTLPQAAERIDKLAVLRADGDFYKSTQDILHNLYPKISMGGYCIIDDYGCFSECRRAVDEYRQQHSISAPIQWVDDEAIYWRVM